jgi:anti-sigma-K factor RskA
MKPVDDSQDRFDQQAKQWHAASLRELSPQTLMRLRAARHAAQAETQPVRGHHAYGRWLAATAFTAVLAVGIGVRLLPLGESASTNEVPAVLVTDSGDAGVNESAASYSTANVLDEDPDLYLWLASADAPPLAME